MLEVTTETTFTGKSGETIIIQRYGRDDYAGVIGEYSVRGTLLQVLQEIAEEIPEGRF